MTDVFVEYSIVVPKAFNKLNQRAIFIELSGNNYVHIKAVRTERQ